VIKLGIISDTRLDDCQALPVKIFEAFAGVDTIIHAGNICKESVLESLDKIAPVKAVRGPLDDPADFTRDLPESKILIFGDYTVGVFNEVPSDDVIAENGINILIHGNTCVPKIDESKSVRLSLDPGSPTFPAKYQNGTVILLKIDRLLFSYIIRL
jgi:hypothetical protein